MKTEAETSVSYLIAKEHLESFNPRRNKVSPPDAAEGVPVAFKGRKKNRMVLF